MMNKAVILILYYSQYGATEKLARAIMRGSKTVSNCEVLLRTVPPVSNNQDKILPAIPDHGPPYCSLDELAACDGLAVGSPTHFGNMAAAMKFFWDQTGLLWQQGALVDKPAAVFTSTGSMHGGMETTLLSMMLPMMHHGMLWLGVPYTVAELNKTRHGGTPYGASHFAGTADESSMYDCEEEIATFLGKRLATLALKLKDK